MSISAAMAKTFQALAWLAALTLSTQAQGQFPTVNLPKPDAEGWIPVFHGDNKGDFSLYTGNGSPAAEGNKAFGSPFFVESGDTLRTTGNPYAQLIFKQNLSHYIAEVQLRWPGNIFNTGMLTKIQWNDGGQGGSLPTSIECQGDPNQGMGQIWSLGPSNARPWITFHGKSHSKGAQADSTQPEMDFGGSGGLNCIVGFPGWQKPMPQAVADHGWVTLRVESHGKDTTRHFVDGQKVMEYHSPRIAKQNDSKNVVKYLTEGMICIQSEGGAVWYRHWRIKLLPEDPLYASLYPVSLLSLPNPVKLSRAKGARLGFDGKTLTVLAGDHKPVNLMGRSIQVRWPQ